MKLPATNLRDAYNALELSPLESGDPRYVDCIQARGEEDVVAMLARRIESSERPVAQLLSGHRGCGKSTELLRLVKRLQDGGYLVVYFAADEDIDIGDLEATDLLLAIVKRLERTLAEKDITVAPALMHDILMWFAEVVYDWRDEEVVERGLKAEVSLGVTAPLPLIAKLLARITGQIRTGHHSKQEVRLRLDPQVSQLIERINLLIQSALPQLKKRGYRDLVLAIDNLDRVVLRILDEQTGRTSLDVIYLEHADQLKALAAHVVYTVPISMFYSPKATQLTGAFPHHAILPMLKVRDEHGAPYGKGIALLHQVAKERIAVDQVFAPGVVRYLAQQSGGVLRDFIRLLGYTIDLADARGSALPIKRPLAERAFHSLVNEYGRMVPFEHFSSLARVAGEKRVRNDAQHQAMLYNLSVLEYLNHGRWCDVHPAVGELPEFKEAWERAYGKGAT